MSSETCDVCGADVTNEETFYRCKKCHATEPTIAVAAAIAWVRERADEFEAVARLASSAESMAGRATMAVGYRRIADRLEKEFLPTLLATVAMLLVLAGCGGKVELRDEPVSGEQVWSSSGGGPAAPQAPQPARAPEDAGTFSDAGRALRPVRDAGGDARPSDPCETTGETQLACLMTAFAPEWSARAECAAAPFDARGVRANGLEGCELRTYLERAPVWCCPQEGGP